MKKLTLSLAIAALSLNAFAQDELTHLSTQLRTGKTSAVEVLTHYQTRSAKLNPKLNAVTALRTEALSDARVADQSGDKSLPLFGLPIMVKDNIAIQGMVTTAGSLALSENMASVDATVSAKLRAAGAILAGKTNLSEWANFRSTKATSGWSSVGGQTRNPYNLKKNTCGSSSGSGAAVAARLIPAAIGTETDGSIVCPASVNGIVGLKPTLGLVSRHGIIPLSHSQDTAGPMTLSVMDAALMLNAIAGSDAKDPATLEADTKRVPDYTSGLSKDALKGKRLGVVAQLTGEQGYDKATLALFKQSLDILKAQGAIIVDNIRLPHLKALEKEELTVLLYDFKADLNAYLAHTPTSVTSRNLQDLMRFNLAHAKSVMPYFKQEIFQMADKKGDLSEKAYVNAAAKLKRLAGPEGIDAVIEEHQLDALIAPTTGPAWDINYKKGDVVAGSASSPAAIAGYPHLTIPMGLVRGLPVGLSLFAGKWQDAALLNMGYAFEQARPALPAPK